MTLARDEFAVAFLKAMGIDAKEQAVVSLGLMFRVGEIAKAQVGMLVTASDGELIEVLEDYEIDCKRVGTKFPVFHVDPDDDGVAEVTTLGEDVARYRIARGTGDD